MYIVLHSYASLNSIATEIKLMQGCYDQQNVHASFTISTYVFVTPDINGA